MILGIGGKKRSGKDTVADHIIKLSEGQYKATAFANSLKRLTSKLLNFDITEENKDTSFDSPKKVRILDIVRFISLFESDYKSILSIAAKFKTLKLLGKVFKSPREALQFVGTEFMRAEFGEDIFIDLVHMDLFAEEKSIVKDVRFDNELEYVRDIPDAATIYVYRPDLESTDTHASENALSVEKFDIVVVNDGTLEQLFDKVEMLYKSNFEFRGTI